MKANQRIIVILIAVRLLWAASGAIAGEGEVYVPTLVLDGEHHSLDESYSTLRACQGRIATLRAEGMQYTCDVRNVRAYEDARQNALRQAARIAKDDPTCAPGKVVERKTGFVEVECRDFTPLAGELTWGNAPGGCRSKTPECEQERKKDFDASMAAFKEIANLHRRSVSIRECVAARAVDSNTQCIPVKGR